MPPLVPLTFTQPSTHHRSLALRTQCRQPAALAGRVMLLAMSLGWSLLMPSVVMAQHGEDAGPGAGRRPPRGQPGTQPQPGGRRPANVKIADEAPLPKIDRESLPPGYQAPRPIPPYLLDCKEWLLSKDENPTPKEKNSFNALKGAGAQLKGKDDVDLIRKIIRWKLSEFTLKSKREQVFKLREDIIVRDLRFANMTQEVKNAMLDAILVEAPTLFDHCLEPRFNAVLLLTDLNVREATSDGKQQAVPFLPACTPLLNVLNNPQQPDIVKIPAAIGAVRYASPVPTPVDLKHKVVEALFNLLKNPQSDPWLQMRCAEGLGQIGFYQNLNKQPVVLTLLLDVVKDAKRNWFVRAEAARAIGRLNLDPNVDLKPIAGELANFGLVMATEYQKSHKQSHWSGCFLNLYFAFWPMDADEKKKGWGLLTLVEKPAFAGHKQIVNAAYRQCIQVIKNVVTPPGDVTMPEAIKNLSDWIKQNSPNGVNIAPAAQQPPAANAAQVTGS